MRKNKGLIYFTILYLTILLAIAFSFSSATFTFAQEEIKYYLGGQVAGFVLKEDGATILSISDIFSEDGIFCPGEDAGLKSGDKILSINGKKIDSYSIVEEELKKYKSGAMILEIERCDQKYIKEIQPIKDINGKYKLGLIIRDAITGIGTITYTNSLGEFSALGHPVIEKDDIYNIVGGSIYKCKVLGVLKSKKGIPGEIKGLFVENKSIGSITCNNKNGIKGKFKQYQSGKEVQLGTAQNGKASVFCTIEGDIVKEYKISIIKCDYNNKQNKNFVIKIDDENLIDKTGGIVQGMSGSPIVQNGKLVGAVTHVFVNDPQKGYGISIDSLISNK